MCVYVYYLKSVKMLSSKTCQVNLFSQQIAVPRKPYWYLMTISGQLKFTEYVSFL